MAESVDYVQIVMAVAIIAIAAIILALSIGYYLIKKKEAALKESQQEAST
jgi:uncharacterized membrane protein (DUF373 family)